MSHLASPLRKDEAAEAWRAIDKLIADTSQEHLPALITSLNARITAVAMRLFEQDKPDQGSELLTIDEAAAYMKVSTTYFYKKNLPFKVKIGNRLLFNRGGMDRWIKNQRRDR